MLCNDNDDGLRGVIRDSTIISSIGVHLYVELRLHFCPIKVCKGKWSRIQATSITKE